MVKPLHQKGTLLLIFFFAVLQNLKAQTPPCYNYTPTTTTNAFPWSTAAGKGIQWIVNAGEFALPSPAAPGQNITEIWFYAASAINATYTSFSVQLGQLPSNTDPAWTTASLYTGPMTTVINPATKIINTGAATWWSMVLDVPFMYDPSQALVVYVSQCGFTGTSAQAASTFSSTGTRRKYLNPVACVQGYSGQDALISPIGLTLASAGPPCAGPPTAGTITGPTMACPGGPVNLLLNNYTLAPGITIQWESSPAGLANWTPIPNATYGSLNTTQTSATDYRAVVTCTNGNFTDITGIHAVTMGQFFNCYCSPLTGNMLHTSTGNYITGVSIAGTTLSSTTGAAGIGGYTQLDPTIQTNTASLIQLVPYTIDVTVGAGTYNAVAWIDYDMSGTFTASEYIPLTTSGTTATGTILIPGTSMTGQTGMRIRAYTTGGYGSGGACSNITTGFETEDYVITINPGTQCSGTPSSGGTITSSNNAAICPGGFAVLSVSGYTLAVGITLQWEESLAGLGNWSPIAGANAATYTTPTLNSSMDYRVLVTCLNGSAFTYSNVYTLNVSTPQIVETYPGSRCNTGPVTILARANAGANVKWYAGASGGAVLGSGNAYTTPSIAATTTYYAEPVLGNGGLDSLAVPIANGTTTGTYWHMFLISTTPGMTINSLSIKANQAIGTLTAWDIYYRPNNYQLTPGANTSSAGWTLLSSVTGVPSAGATTYTTIASNLNLVMPPSSTYSFHIAPVAGATHQYATTASGTTTASNATASIISGHRGSLFNCTTAGGQAIMKVNYSLGCIGSRVPVAATINSSPSGSGLSTGGTTTGTLQPDGTTIDYIDACNDKVATVADAQGGNVLGVTSAVVLTSPAVKTFNGIAPYVPRAFDITPASSGAATVTLYVLQSEFTAYNSYVTTNNLGLPLLPTGPADVVGMGNIVITQFHGNALAGNTGPFGLYSTANASFIPNASITKSSNGTYWSLTFAVTGFSGFFVHTGSTPLAIDLKSISAANVGNRNRIDWTTSKELADDRFEIERSADGKNFTRLGNVDAKGQASSYSYWDEQPFAWVNYYRLKMLHTSGNETYSQVVNASMRGAGAFGLEAFPNPVSDMLTIKVYGTAPTMGVISIMDIAGKLIRTISLTNNEIAVDMRGIAKGTYIIKYLDATHSETIKVNKL